jgi:hypothetical protein
LKRALDFPQVEIDRQLIIDAIPFAVRTVEHQHTHFISDPGVFSYDTQRIAMHGREIATPPQMHIPKLDDTLLPADGIFVVITGIEGLAESGMYDAAREMGLQIYSGDDKFNEANKGLKHSPLKIANPRIKAQVARTGWSSVWGNHMVAKHGLDVGFLYPPHQPMDDPEILMNNQGVHSLGLGAVIDVNQPRKSLELALERAKNNRLFNTHLERKFGTLDGIEYIAKKIHLD